MIGVVPAGLNVAQLFAPLCDAAEKALADVLAQPRKAGRPTKKEQEAIDVAAYHVERLKERTSQVAAFEEHAGKLAFFYMDAVHRVVRVRVQAVGGGDSSELVLGNTPGVFNHGMFAVGARPKSLDNLQGRSLVVQSEFDLLQLQSLAAHMAEIEGQHPQAGYLKAVAVSEGVVDAQMVRSLGQMPLVIRNGADAVGVRMIDALRRVLNLLVAVVPKAQTLDYLLHSQADSVNAHAVLLDVANMASLVTRPFDAVQLEIDEWRSLEERQVKKFQADRWATQTLVQDISQRGQLFYDGRTAYVFDKGSKQLLPMDRDNADTRAFLARYGVAPSDGFLKQALSAIQLKAQENGQETIVHSLSHYAATTNRLFLFDQDRYVYRISPTRVERVENGTDGVLFVRNPKWEPFEIGTSRRHSTSCSSTTARASPETFPTRSA